MPNPANPDLSAWRKERGPGLEARTVWLWAHRDLGPALRRDLGLTPVSIDHASHIHALAVEVAPITSPHQESEVMVRKRSVVAERGLPSLVGAVVTIGVQDSAGQGLADLLPNSRAG
jgi:hypothetical protein